MRLAPTHFDEKNNTINEKESTAGLKMSRYKQLERKKTKI